MHSLIQLDIRLFFLINHAHNRALDYLMLAISGLGELAIGWWIFAIILSIMDRKRGWRVALLLAAAILLTVFIDNEIIKQMWSRPRPYMALAGVHQLGYRWGSSSFPSGHASSAVAATIVAGYFFRKLRIPLAIFTLLTLYSRPYLGMHYPLDVLAGVPSGIVSGLITLCIGARILSLSKDVAKPPAGQPGAAPPGEGKD